MALQVKLNYKRTTRPMCTYPKQKHVSDSEKNLQCKLYNIVNITHLENQDAEEEDFAS